MFYTWASILGDIRAWQIVQLPAKGQIFNVSQLVLPERAGMADHGQQPMLPELDKLVEYARLQVERERLRLERQQAKTARKAEHQHEPASRPSKSRTYSPQNKLLREYDTCRVAMLEYERAVREVVGREGEVTPQAIYADAGGPSPKTLKRVMHRHGLRYRVDWPPSTWPQVAPVSRVGTN